MRIAYYIECINGNIEIVNCENEDEFLIRTSDGLNDESTEAWTTSLTKEQMIDVYKAIENIIGSKKSN